MKHDCQRRDSAKSRIRVNRRNSAKAKQPLPSWAESEPMRQYRPLESDETAALQAFADAHGRKWKDALANVYWYNARIWIDGAPGMGNTLHAIRNEFGPTWLFNHCRIKPAGKRPHRERVKPLERNPWRDF